MCPKSLRSILASWHTSPATRSHPFPKFVYTTPTGANPAGTTASEQRKREVLAVVREYGVLLLEDDPYIFLGFEGLGEDPVTRDRGRSYFSLETDGREQAGDGFVARFDSFSKVRLRRERVVHTPAHAPCADHRRRPAHRRAHRADGPR
jgi:tryptophan aminotransferase